MKTFGLSINGLPVQLTRIGAATKVEVLRAGHLLTFYISASSMTEAIAEAKRKCAGF